MGKPIRSAAYVPGTVVVGVAAGLLATGCAPAKNRTRDVRTHEATFEQVQRGSGPGPAVERRLRLGATVVETPDGNGGYRLAVTQVNAEGDPEQVEAARRLVGREVLIGPKQSQVSIPAPPADGVGLPQPGDVFLLFSALMSSQPAGEPASRKATTNIGGGPAQVVSLVDTPKGKERTGGLKTRLVEGTGTATIQASVIAYRASADASNRVVAEPGFTSRFGGEASYPFETRTTSRTVTESVPVTKTIPGKGIGFGELVFCIFTLGLGCPDSGSAPTPARTETRYEKRNKVVKETQVLRPPPVLQADVTGIMALTASRQLHQRDARVLSASGRGSMTLTGTLPEGDTVPAAIRSRPVTTTSEWTYADRLLSPPPEEESRNPVPPLVALFLLVAVGSATGVTARHTRTRR